MDPASGKASLEYQYPRNTRRPRKHTSSYENETCDLATDSPTTRPSKSNTADSRQLRNRKQIDYYESSDSNISESPKNPRGYVESSSQEYQHCLTAAPTSTSGSVTQDLIASNPVGVLLDALGSEQSPLELFDIGLLDATIRVDDRSGFNRGAHAWGPPPRSLPNRANLKEEHNSNFQDIKNESLNKLRAPDNLETVFEVAPAVIEMAPSVRLPSLHRAIAHLNSVV